MYSDDCYIRLRYICWCATTCNQHSVEIIAAKPNQIVCGTVELFTEGIRDFGLLQLVQDTRDTTGIVGELLNARPEYSQRFLRLHVRVEPISHQVPQEVNNDESRE